MNNVLSINANNIRITNNKVTTSPNFRSNDVTKTDVIETHEKTSKELSNGAKTCIGVASALAIAGGVTYAILRKPGEGKRAVDKAKEELGKDWKEAMEFFNIKQLPEHIDFKEAKTIEEALKYGKEVLGIEYRLGAKGWNIDAVNFINKAIVDISNAMKGKANLPERAMPSLTSSNQDDVMAQILNNGKDLDVNGVFFQKSGFDKMCELTKNSKIFEKLKEDNVNLIDLFNVKTEGNFQDFIEKCKNSELSYIEKWVLYGTISKIMNGTLHQVLKNPQKIYKLIAEKKPSLNLDVNKFILKTPEEQTKELKNLLTELKKNGNAITININECASPYEIIYHEMGHSQHYVTDYMKMNTSDKKVFKDKHNDYSKTKEIWDKMREKGQIQSWHSPILEFFNPKNQTIANEVSDYATKSPAEFIAETFAKKMQGYRFSDEVETMYKKYHGPEILNPPPSKEPIWHFE